MAKLGLPRRQAFDLTSIFAALLVIGVFGVFLSRAYAPLPGAQIKPVRRLIFLPSDDATINAGKKNRHYSRKPTLVVRNKDKRQSRTDFLIKFPVLGVGAGEIKRARLKICVANSSNRGGVFRAAQHNDWNEQTVNWTSAPRQQGQNLAVLGRVRKNKCYYADLTERILGDGVYSFRVFSTSRDTVAFYSGESRKKPILVVDVHDPVQDEGGSGEADSGGGDQVGGDQGGDQGGGDQGNVGGGEDVDAPQVEIVSPSDGQTISDLVAIEASASDDVRVAKVEFFIDSDLLANDFNSPYSAEWDTRNVPDGTYAISVQAYDSSGNVGFGDTIFVAVSNETQDGGGGDTPPPDDTLPPDDGGGDTPPTDTAPGEDTTPPSAPANLRSPSNTEYSVNLSWTGSNDDTGVAGYYIYRDDAIFDIAATNTYADDYVGPGETHTYYVTAFDGTDNESAPSNTITVDIPSSDGGGDTIPPDDGGGDTLPPDDGGGEDTLPPDDGGGDTTPSDDTTPPSAPTNMRSPSHTDYSVTLSWTDSTDDFGVAGYNVYRDGEIFDITSSGAYTDFSVQPGETHSYYATAFDGTDNESAPSNIVTVTITQPDTTPPSAPNLQAKEWTYSSVTLQWTIATDNVKVTGYEVQRYSPGSCNYACWAIIATTTATTYKDYGVSPTKQYVYRVVARDAANNSTPSNQVSVLTPSKPTTCVIGCNITK